jgi:hypothetical protein
MYDYLDVYFEFCGQDPSDPQVLKKAKEIVSKYSDFPIIAFKKVFDKVRDQIYEIENSSMIEE